MPRETFCFLIIAQRQLICSSSGVKENETCLLQFLFIWVTWNRQGEGGWSRWYEWRELQVLPYLPALSLARLCWDWGMFASLLQGKKGCGCFCCCAHSTAQVAAWSLGSGHANVCVHISWAREGPIPDLFGFIPVTLLSRFCVPAPQSIIFLIRLLWSLVLSQPLWIFTSPRYWSNKSVLERELHLITT